MKKLKIWDWVSTAVFLLGAILFCWGCVRTERLDNLISSAGMAVAAISVIISVVKQRCPFCKRYLGLFYDPKREFCPYCGGKIDSD